MSKDQLKIEEIHRFPNGPIKIFATLRWDTLHILDELKKGLLKVAARSSHIDSISVDSWGVDYVYLRSKDPLLSLPYNYRDTRTDGAFQKALALVSRNLIYSQTGIQFMQMNTLYQLLDDLEHRHEILEISDQFLNIADYFNYLLSGIARAEESLASTTQLFNPRARTWSWELIEKLGFPARIFPKLVQSGTKLGPLEDGIGEELGLKGTQVIAGCSHDTGAAVAAVPAEGRDWCYLSSGTWSVVGIELEKPLINASSLTHGFANEVGYGGTIRFLKNIAGLWVVQECRREWHREGYEYSYDDLTRMAQEAAPLKCLINPAASQFVRPGHMPKKIINYCRETNQPPPKTHEETIRCVLESLALMYHHVLREVVTLTGQEPKYLHIVGGGSKNQLLNQLTANATQVPVLAGPSEATAIGNMLVQAIALGHLHSLIDLRRVVRHSFPIDSYTPEDGPAWRKAYERFQRLTAKSLANRE
jgi:rhamnulokinase